MSPLLPTVASQSTGLVLRDYGLTVKVIRAANTIHYNRTGKPNPERDGTRASGRRCDAATIPRVSLDNEAVVSPCDPRISRVRRFAHGIAGRNGVSGSVVLSTGNTLGPDRLVRASEEQRGRTIVCDVGTLRHSYRLCGYSKVNGGGRSLWGRRAIGRDPARMGFCRVSSGDRSSTRTRRRRRNPLPDEGR